ncbi:hypothetical protein L3X38_024627 [Prunus dulcis]|uniref:Copia protein n=1 Tax=Prunus dulcis TaxID=3755 RepID=A0AAD4Z6P2_PRUDU|nr:hypothetical protein L3X38_024627 [Prunus dulcis]
MQSSVALSTAEAEYISAAEAIAQAIWLRFVLSDFREEQVEPTQLLCDNTLAIAISKNPVHHHKTRHINRRFSDHMWEIKHNAFHIGKYISNSLGHGSYTTPNINQGLKSLKQPLYSLLTTFEISQASLAMASVKMWERLGSRYPKSQNVVPCAMTQAIRSSFWNQVLKYCYGLVIKGSSRPSK